MESLTNIEAFVRSAEAGGFSAAARRLGLTPAAISRNVAQLEASLGVRLFQRSTRRLTLTEAGERFLHGVSGGLDIVRGAIADAATDTAAPSGVLKVSLGTNFGLDYLLPLLPDFMTRYPGVTPDWHFDNRAVDLVGEGVDAAIGGGFELSPGIVARELGRVHMVAVAAPSYLQSRVFPKDPGELAGFDGIVMRSPQTGRIRTRVLRHESGKEEAVELKPRVILNDPEAMARSAVLGLGVAIVALPHVLRHFVSGALMRVVPDWYVDAGPISIYYASKTLLPAKTRCFVDFIVEQFQRHRLARRFSAF